MNYTAIILAAGQSKRFGEANKLFASYHDKPLIDHCLNLVIECDFTDRIIVTGYERERVENHVQQMPIRIVHNPHFQTGMGSSLSMGVREIKADCDAFLIFLADMPDIPASVIRDILATFKRSDTHTKIIRPTRNAIPGHPVLFATSLRPEFLHLTGDQGALELIKKHKTSTRFVEVSSPAVIRDIDQTSDLN